MYLVPDLKGKEILMYLRKSRSDDPLMTVEEVLQNHEQMLDDWMTTHQPQGGQIPEENRFREVVSGETIDSRPKVQEVLRQIESPNIKAVLVKEPSRLSRGDLQDIGYLVKVLMYTGTLVLTLQGAYDLRDDRDREQFERELMRGNDYLQYQKKILKDGKLLAAKNGYYISPFPPYGYKKVSIKDGKKTCHTLEPIPEEAEVVNRVFVMYAQGIGPIRISEILDKEHVKPPVGEKWSNVTIDSMLRNVHYLGKVKWNHRPRTHTVEGGEIKRRRFSVEDYLIFEGKHPAIISQELWDAVQAIKGQIPRNKKDSEPRNTLAKILYCSCGYAMRWQHVTYKGKKIGVPRYNCGNPRCKANGSATFHEIIQEVTQTLADAIDDFEERIEQGADNSAEIHKQTVVRMENKLKELKDLEAKQWDEKIKGRMPEHVFERLNSQTVAEIEDITQALCEAKDSAPVHVDIHEKLVIFKSALALLEDPDAPVKEQNALLQACVERIVYSRPRQGRRGGNKGNPHPFKLEFTLRV